MKILLSGKYGTGKHTEVSPCDYEKATKYSLHVNSDGYVKLKYKGSSAFLHRYLLDVVDSSVMVDHINGNPLDNTRENLRVCGREGNARNRKSQTHSSRYKGVTWNKRLGKYVSQIRINKKKIHLGCFLDEMDAALAYDRAAIHYFGDFSRTNF